MPRRSYIVFGIAILLATAVPAFKFAQYRQQGRSTSFSAAPSLGTGACMLCAVYPPTIKAEVIPSATPLPGSQVNAILKLSQLDGTPVTSGDLKISHTRRIHLLIVNEALNDYSHVHPIPTSVPGSFSFSFRPRYGGHYAVWADLLPVSTGREEYARTDLWVSGPSAVPSQWLNRSASSDHYWFDLSTPKNMPLVAGQMASVQVIVSDPQGRPVTHLEPLMGAFAHGVGFTSNLSSILHVHPLGSAAISEKDRGGPTLDFNILPRQPGYLKFFVQVQLDGKNVFAGFGLHVLSLADAKGFSQFPQNATIPTCD